MKSKKRCLFIGRYQPFHKGHEWLIEQKLKDYPVAIAVRDCGVSNDNPIPAKTVKLMIEEFYRGQDVVVLIIPDILGVYYGRDVGYEVQELEPPPDIRQISATKIRKGIT